MKNQKNSGTENTPAKKRKVNDNVEQAKKTRYLVETKGYKETFETYEKSKVQFDILKKRAIKQQQKITIKIYEKEENHKKLIDELNVTESYFED